MLRLSVGDRKGKEVLQIFVTCRKLASLELRRYLCEEAAMLTPLVSHSGFSTCNVHSVAAHFCF